MTRWHKGQPFEGMPWSRLRKVVESLFADCVKGRVALHITQFRTCNDRCGRGWITIDGVEVLSASTHRAGDTFFAEWARLYEALPETNESEASAKNLRDIYCVEHVIRAHSQPAYSVRSARASMLARDEMMRRGIFGEGDFCDALRWYAQASINDILASDNPIVRAVAMLDRRVGKRRLRAIDLKKEHALVQRLLEFRLEADKQKA